MAKYTDLKKIIMTQFAAPEGNKISYLVLGKPGGGKSALAFDIAKSLGFNENNTVVFTPSLRDPVDVLGTPRNDGEVTRWVPPVEFWKLRQGVGPCCLIVEEMTDASIPMMNAMCRIVHDRHAGDLELSDQLFIIGTGNRTEDMSGANRLATKLGNRLNVQEFDENLDDWVAWALAKGIDPVLIQFLRFKPNLLSDFDPKRPFGINPTPRSWEKVALSPVSLGTALFMQNIRGMVGDGAATEYAAFRKIHDSLISFDEILANPEGVKMPVDLSAKYAIVGSVSVHTTAKNIDKVTKFVGRLEPDFAVMFWNDTQRRLPEIRSTKAFINWASSVGNAVCGAR